jgi:ABC-type amino acid transport substrate-binding protein
MSIRNLAPRFATSLTALCLGTAVLAGPAQAETLKIGNEGTYPPFSIVDSSGTLTGFEPDLAREVCKRMGTDCEFVVMDFKALIPSLLQGKFALIATQLTPTPERKEKLLLSKPIVYNPATFVVKKDNNLEITKEGVAGKGLKIGLQRGAFTGKWVQDRFGDSLQYVYYDNPDQVRLDLLAGRIDMTFDSKINWKLELIDKPEGKDWKLAGGDHWAGDQLIPEAERGSVWAVRKGEDALLKRIDEALAAVKADCTYTKIRKKYLDISILPEDEACTSKTN